MTKAQGRLKMAGYANLPLGEISQCEVGNVGVLGVPSEVDSGLRSGASLAPDALRKMSKQLGIDLPVHGRDLGNLDLSGDWPEVLMQLVTQMVSCRVMPVVLGGAIDVASAVLRALPDLPVVAALPLARRDLVQRPADTILLGLNGGQPADIWDQIIQRKIHWSTARQLDEGRANIFEMPEHAVLWIDISVIDLGHAAGAIGLNPGGMKPETLVSIIGAMSCDWQAIVITGLAPACDTRGVSELASIEVLNAALRHG